VEGPRTLTLARLAVHTFAEACVHETVATLCATRQAARCEFDDVRETLEMIVDDEADHAALAWRTVRWAIETGGNEVLSEVLAHAATHRPSLDPFSFNEDEPKEALLRSHGRIPRSDELQISVRAWSDIIDPMLDELTRIVA